MATLTIKTSGGTLGVANEVVNPRSFAIGVNLDGMEYGNQSAVANFNYAIPSLSELQYHSSTDFLGDIATHAGRPAQCFIFSER